MNGTCCRADPVDGNIETVCIASRKQYGVLNGTEKRRLLQVWPRFLVGTRHKVLVVGQQFALQTVHVNLGPQDIA